MNGKTDEPMSQEINSEKDNLQCHCHSFNCCHNLGQHNEKYGIWHFTIYVGGVTKAGSKRADFDRRTEK